MDQLRRRPRDCRQSMGASPRSPKPKGRLRQGLAAALATARSQLCVESESELQRGLAYVKTYPYGDHPAVHEFPENRAWEQVVYTGKALGLEWQNRLRLEQRWIGEMKNTSTGWDVNRWRYENRIRYMLRTTVPLTENKKTYVALWNEVFVNFGSNVAGNIFDQNRAFAGVGRKLTDTTRVELGFMEQTLQRRHASSATPQVWENNHTITLWVISKWPFGKG